MRPIQVITDSTADLNAELLEKYNLDYARMKIIDGRKEYFATFTWDDFTPQQLYDDLRSGKMYRTSQVPADEFKRVFMKYLDQGKDIVYIACPEKSTGTMNTGIRVSKEVLASYPGARIEVVDSYNISIAQGMLAIRASEDAAKGMTIDEIVADICAVRNKVHEFGTIDGLTHFKRSGRISAGKAFLGNLMGIRPLVAADAYGVQYPIMKVKGRKASLDAIVDKLAEHIIDPESQTVYIDHANCPESEVEYLKQRVREKIPCKDIYVVIECAAAGVTSGPGSVAVFGYGDEITKVSGE